jgi:hypothetical protein
MAVIKLKDDAGNWVPLNKVIKPTPTPTLVNTRTYSVPATGGEFWVDTVAAGGTVSLPLPLAPANNTTVSVQIVDNGLSDLFLTPTAPDTIGFQAVGLSGKYAGASRNLGETLKYINGRWLPYYGRLVYQAAIAAIVLPPETVFFAMFEGANNSTTFTDLRANPISVRSGTPMISTAQSLFGNGSLFLDGLSSLVVPAAASLVSGTQEFEWEIALYPTAFLVGNAQGIIEQRAVGNATPEGVFILNQTAQGLVAHETGQTTLARTRLKLNQWQLLKISRYQDVKTIYLDDVPVYVGTDNINYNSVGSLIIGDMIDTAFPYSGMFTGYIQYVRKTIGSAGSTGYQAGNLTFARPPLTDADPLDAFKVLDINCDTGVILDTKGHVITSTGAVVVSGVQKRAGSHSIALTGGALDIAGGTDFNFGTTPYSIQVSLNMSVVNSNQYFVDFDGGNQSCLSSIGTDWRIAVNNALALAVVETPLANRWYELQLAKIDTKYLLIRNQQIIGASNNAPTTASFSTMRVGGYRGGGITIQGYLDSVSVYKGIANGANLTHAYPLRFLARFSGGSVNDELGAVGTIVGTAPTYDTVNKRSLEASALFPGTGYITYPQIPAYDLGGGGFEIAGWTLSSATPNAVSGVVANGVAVGLYDAQSWFICDNNPGSSFSGNTCASKLSFWVGPISGNTALLASKTTFNAAQPHYWRIIKYVLGATAVTVIIVDGKIEDVYIGNYTFTATTRPLTVGNITNGSGRNFKGNQDDIAIYKA